MASGFSSVLLLALTNHVSPGGSYNFVQCFPVNHTSDHHPWFKEACRDPLGKYRDWYVWSKKKAEDRQDRHGVPRGAEVNLDLRRPGQGLLLSPLPRVPA